MDDVLVPTWFSSPSARAWTAPGDVDSAREFHRSLPGHAVTPLVDLPALAAELGVGLAWAAPGSSHH